ncbi:NodB homology domain-containing protein [Plasmodiophora brassicae]
MKIVVAAMLLLLLLVTTVAGAACEGAPRPDNRCGPWVSGAGCPPGSCCSPHGWCGTGSDYCNDESMCTPDRVATACWAPPRPDNRCGTAVGNAGCRPGQCCSRYGWCGSSSAYCNEQSICPSVLMAGPHPPVPVTVGDVSVFDWCGPIPWISVTFDDSVFVEPQLTNLLNDLERLAIPATFFICPTCYRGDVSFCSQLARVIDAGHSIQSHSMSHPNFKTLDTNAISAEIDSVEDYLDTFCDLDVPMSMFRPPYGELGHTQALFVNSLGYTIASWTVDSMDWTGATLPAIQAAIAKEKRRLGPDASLVIVLHDAHYATPGARGILDWLVQAHPGHDFVSVEQCFANCRATGTCRAPGDPWPGVFDGP